MKRHGILHACLCLAAAGLHLTDAKAEDVRAQRDLVNQGIVGLLVDSAGGSDLQLAVDMANVLNDSYSLRVMPIVGEGSVRNVEDLLYLRGIDVATVQADVLDFYKSAQAYANLEKRLNYIALLDDEEIHLIARDNVRSVDGLSGLKVNLGPETGSTFLSANIIFDQLGVEVDVETYPHEIALRELRAGNIDAMMFAEGQPIEIFQQLRKEEGLHFLPLDADSIGGSYIQSFLKPSSYPGLIDLGQEVETVAVAEVLAAYNWPDNHPRQERVERFVEALVDNLDELTGGEFHERWEEVEFDEDVPGWDRLPSAAEAIEAAGLGDDDDDD